MSKSVKSFRLLSALLLSVLATPGLAQINTPPAGYSGTRFVDADGCVYVRAGTASWTLSRDAEGRAQCGGTPTRFVMRDAQTLRTTVTPRPAMQARRAIPADTVPRGYKRAWTDGRLNPYAGRQLLSGALQTSLVWTQTVPRRLKTQDGRDATHEYNYLIFPYTDYAAQRAALASGRYVTVRTRAGQQIVPRVPPQ